MKRIDDQAGPNRAESGADAGRLQGQPKTSVRLAADVSAGVRDANLARIAEALGYAYRVPLESPHIGALVEKACHVPWALTTAEIRELGEAVRFHIAFREPAQP